MCVSAPVSFSLSGLLFLSGAYCMHRAASGGTRLIPLAIVPIAFGVQQFCEVWVWVGLNRSDPSLARIATLAYLSFALLFWPVWVPVSALLTESRRVVRVFLLFITLLGLALGSCLFLPILFNPAWLSVQIVEHSIHYDTNASPVLSSVPGFAWQLTYFAVVAIPLFVSPIWRSFHFGVALVLSAALSRVLFPHAAASMWCFFAAALSLYLSALFFLMPAPVARAAAA